MNVGLFAPKSGHVNPLVILVLLLMWDGLPESHSLSGPLNPQKIPFIESQRAQNTATYIVARPSQLCGVAQSGKLDHAAGTKKPHIPMADASLVPRL